MVDPVLHGQDILVVVDQSNVLVAGVEEYLLRSEIVRWCVQTDDEMARKQVLLQRIVIRVRVDEDVGKRRSRVADVAATVKQGEQLADLPIDPGYFVAGIRGVDLGVIGFIVNQQHWLAHHLSALVDRMLLEPFQQVLERAGILLYHQYVRNIVLTDLAGIRSRSRLVEISQSVGQRDREFSLIECADSNDLLTLGLVGMSQPSGVSANESFVNPRLGLVAQVVVDSSYHDDQAISSIGSLAYQPGVVRRLAALDVSDDHSAAAPRTHVLRISEAIQHTVRHFVGCVGN
jgi:hypothetical protein